MLVEVLVSGVVGAAFGASGGALAAGVVTAGKFDRMLAVVDSARSVIAWVDERHQSGFPVDLDPELQLRIDAMRKSIRRVH